MPGSRERLGEILRHRGILDPEGLHKALRAQEIFGGRLGTNLVDLDIASIEDVGHCLHLQHGVQVAMRKDFLIADQYVLSKVPAEVCSRYKVFPLWVEGKVLHLAMLDPHELNVIDEISFALGVIVRPYVAPELRLLYYLELHFGLPRESRFLSFRDDEPEIPTRKHTESKPTITMPGMGPLTDKETGEFTGQPRRFGGQQPTREGPAIEDDHRHGLVTLDSVTTSRERDPLNFHISTEEFEALVDERPEEAPPEPEENVVVSTPEQAPPSPEEEASDRQLEVSEWMQPDQSESEIDVSIMPLEDESPSAEDPQPGSPDMDFPDGYPEIHVPDKPFKIEFPDEPVRLDVSNRPVTVSVPSGPVEEISGEYPAVHAGEAEEAPEEVEEAPEEEDAPPPEAPPAATVAEEDAPLPVTAPATMEEYDAPPPLAVEEPSRPTAKGIPVDPRLPGISQRQKRQSDAGVAVNVSGIAAALDKATDRDGITQLLVDPFLPETSLSVLFVIRDGAAVALRASDTPATEEEVSSVTVSLSNPSLLADAYTRKIPVRTQAAEDPLLQMIAAQLQAPEPGEAIVVPISLGGRVINLLCVQSMQGSPFSVSATALLQLVTEKASMAYMRLIQLKKQQKS